MKAIQPVLIWANGVNSQATQLSLTIINDNLSTSATLYYQLLSEDGTQLAQGNLTIDGEQYQTWAKHLMSIVMLTQSQRVNYH